jgi:predicted metal-dependent hydrolase
MVNIENAEEEEALFMEALHGGVALFDQHDFHGAYEIWEKRWQEEVTEGAQLLQGLMQVAFAFAKIKGGQPSGAEKLLSTGRSLIDLYAPEAYGLDILGTLALVDQWQAVAQKLLHSKEVD